MRAIWSGEISFGLVTIPVKLYSATKDLTPQFNQLHKECGTKINMVRRCPKCARDVGYDEVGKGYEVTKGQYALFTKEELAAIEGEDSAGGVDIAEFVDPAEVDSAYFDKSYWVGPAGRSSRGYELLHAALTDTKKAAVARVKIRSRTRLGLLRPRGKLFALDMMRYGDEMVPDLEIDKPEGNKPPSPREVQLALDLVKQLSGPFDPTKHPDQYRAGVQAAVDAKVEANQVQAGNAVEEPISAQGGQLIDLAEMLARSLRATTPANTGGEEKPGPKKTEEPAAAAPEEKKPKKKKASG